MALISTAKILIVDDMVAMLVAMRRALGQLGYSDIIEAENGEEAFAALKSQRDIAMVISDWNMEPVDGLELLNAVRADARLAHLPFILASAEAQALRQRMNDASRAVVLQKPFDVDALRAAIASAL